MKRRRITREQPQPRVRLYTDTPESDRWDVEATAHFPKGVVTKVFRAALEQHKTVILQLATSRLALDSALTSVQDQLSAMTNNAVEIASPQDTLAIDTAYSTGLRLYVYNHVLATIPDEAVRKELLSALATVVLTAKPPPANAATPGERSPGSLRTASTQPNGTPPPGDLEGAINRLERRLTKAIGPVQPEAPTRRREARVRRKPK